MSRLHILLSAGLLLAEAPAPAAPRWDTKPDTWVAVDALGRTLPTYKEVGPPRPGKTVGIFYFLWLGEHGEQGPFDVSKILARDPGAIDEPANPAWGPVGAPHHWGESAFGYYLSRDPWVLRKHAQMLTDAGVDTLVFDVTNQLTYPRSYLALCKTFAQIRKEGGATPQIAFLTPFWDPVKVVRTLYQDLYKPGLYRDLWFRWEGKPLILADPDLITPQGLRETRREPAVLNKGETLGQSFTAERPFTAVSGSFPTWSGTDSGVTLTLRRDGPGGAALAEQRFERLQDNATASVKSAKPLPPGRYYLEISHPSGQVGWWTQTGDTYGGGKAFSNGVPVDADRVLSIRYTDLSGATIVSPVEGGMSQAAAEALAREIKAFFTFRKPQPDYFQGPTGPRQWGWLEVFPQHAFYRDEPGKAEQVTVGVAQNAVDGRLSVLSNPRSHGRSFHNGAEPPPAGQDTTGRNFAEQWKRALGLDPSFIFVTGWNEWIAGRFNKGSEFHAMGPVSFVDQFNAEFSRDVEPAKAPHGDNYYYQMAAAIRRYKGVRKPERAGPPKTIRIDGDFRDWTSVRPEFRDDRFDTAHRDHPGWGAAGRYVDRTGRNDLVLMKVARDAKAVAFYAQTRDPITAAAGAGWMTLLVNTDASLRTGWNGFDVVINRTPPKAGRAVVEAWRNGAWRRVATVPFRVRGREMELSVPRRALGLTKPIRLDLKWLDNVNPWADPLNLYRHGDTAPNGRFAYRCEE